MSNYTAMHDLRATGVDLTGLPAEEALKLGEFHGQLLLAELDQLTSRLRDGVDQLVRRLAEVEATTGCGRKGRITHG